MISHIKMIEWKKFIPIFSFFVFSLLLFVFMAIKYFSLTESINLGNVQLLKIKEKTAISIESEKKFESFDRQLNALSHEGYMGEPQRLAWLEVLRRTVNFLQIPQVRFTLSPTVNELDLKGEDDPGQEKSDLSLTPMTLEMELMHERDFYDFITRFKAEAPGVFRVDDCEIKMIDEKDHDRPILLTAVCQIMWLNYRDIRKNWEVVL